MTAGTAMRKAAIPIENRVVMDFGLMPNTGGIITYLNKIGQQHRMQAMEFRAAEDYMFTEDGLPVCPDVTATPCSSMKARLPCPAAMLSWRSSDFPLSCNPCGSTHWDAAKMHPGDAARPSVARRELF